MLGVFGHTVLRAWRQPQASKSTACVRVWRPPQRAQHAPARRTLHERPHTRQASSTTSGASEGQSPPPPPPPSPNTGLRWFVRGLLRTSALVGLSMALGDVACQAIALHSQDEGQRGKAGGGLDTQRTARMWLIGTFSSGPLGHSWMVLLERLLPGHSLSVLGAKVAANSVYAFFVSLPVMFTAVTLLAPGGTVAKVRDKLAADLLPTFAAGALYWPFVNLFTFRFVALDNRALVGSVFGVAWNVFLSFKANARLPEPRDSAPQQTAPDVASSA